jgi:hypothetical protein
MRYRYRVQRPDGVRVSGVEIHEGRPPPLGTTVEVKLITGETVRGCVGAARTSVSKRDGEPVILRRERRQA